MKAPAPNAKPYGWVVEYPAGKEKHTTFIPNNGESRNDKAFVIEYAARLYGVWAPVEKGKV